MTTPRPVALDALEATAQECAAAEREFRETSAREIERLETERRRAYRRFNFLTALVLADAGAEGREASRAAQRATAADELDWREIDATRAEALDAMAPLADAVHDERLLAQAELDAAVASAGQAETGAASRSAGNPAEARVAAILMAFSAFEARFEELRGRPFAELFDRTFPETPLVDF